MAAIFSAFVLVAMLVLLVREYWLRLFETEGLAARRQFLLWTCKGLVVPIVFWLLINCGLVPGMPILLPEIALAQSRGGAWVRLLARSCAPVLLITGSYWAAITFGWLQTLVAGRVQDRRELRAQLLFWSTLLLPVAGLIYYLLGQAGLGLALLVWLVASVHLTLPLALKKKIPPSYARAVARMKFGKYKDAEREILLELEKCEDNVEGWMMLADLYANHFNDLSEADRTLRELCGQPNVTGIQISLALHRLAEWHLSQADDPARARSALEEVCLRLPGTHFARMARQRIDQLPATGEELRERRKTKTFKLPAPSDNFEDTLPAPPTDSDLREAKAQADRCVERLQRNPNDSEAREKFATILAERLGEVDLAVEQLDLLLAMPDQPAPKSAEWLARSAAWQMKYCRDPAAARVRLEQLVREFPQTPQAFAAQRRLNLMEVEERFRKARSTVR
jgi:tetratricopeptide (TPR) repeat protein